MNLDGLSLTLSREPRKKNSERATACAGVRRGWKCADVDGVLFTACTIPFLVRDFVMGLCSAIRPNNEPLRGSTQVVPDSVTSVVGKRGGGSGIPNKLRRNT